MKDFLEKLVSYIVSEGVSFEIKEEVFEGLITYTILVPEEEIGKIIGKEGRVISAIRTLYRLKAVKEQKRVLIKVERIQ
jgi:predicted RNA-binding protein YlqC (UPF0109 family)